jgi:tetratricopeptide (TPR) repeat protein
MNWILAGTMIGLTVAIFRWLFDWDSTVANYVLFGTTGVIIVFVVLLQFLQYQKIRRMLKSYMALLENGDIELYIEQVIKAIEKTKPKHYKDIHRMNLATGYSYLGKFDLAINQLKIVYESSRTATKTAIFSLINIAYYYIQMGDYEKAEKLMKTLYEDPKILDKDPQINFLFHLNYSYISLKKKDVPRLKEYLEKAQIIQRSFGSGDIELMKLQIEVSIARKNVEEARQQIELFKTLNLPPFERQWLLGMEKKL